MQLRVKSESVKRSRLYCEARINTDLALVDRYEDPEATRLIICKATFLAQSKARDLWAWNCLSLLEQIYLSLNLPYIECPVFLFS